MDSRLLTLGLLALIGCSSTTATYAEHEEPEQAGASTVSSSPAKATAASVTATASGGATQVAGGSASEAGGSSQAAGGTSPTSSSTLVLPNLGGAQSRFSFPEQLPASGGADAAGGSSASSSSIPRTVTAPVVAGAAGAPGVAGAPSDAGTAGVAGRAPYYSVIDNQVHPITDDPTSVWDYDRFVGVGCGTILSNPYDLCEPIDPSLPVTEWKWQAKRVPGNPLITGCLSQGDLACSRFDAQKLCGRDVQADGTCGSSPHFEPLCGDADYRAPMTCWRVCLACTDTTTARPPTTCSAAKSALTGGLTCAGF